MWCDSQPAKQNTVLLLTASAHVWWWYSPLQVLECTTTRLTVHLNEIVAYSICPNVFPISPYSSPILCPFSGILCTYTHVPASFLLYVTLTSGGNLLCRNKIICFKSVLYFILKDDENHCALYKLILKCDAVFTEVWNIIEHNMSDKTGSVTSLLGLVILVSFQIISLGLRLPIVHR